MVGNELPNPIRPRVTSHPRSVSGQFVMPSSSQSDQTRRIYPESFRSEDSFPGDLHRVVLVSTAILFAILRCGLLGVPGGANFTQIDSLADIANFHYQNIPLQYRADTFND